MATTSGVFVPRRYHLFRRSDLQASGRPRLKRNKLAIARSQSPVARLAYGSLKATRMNLAEIILCVTAIVVVAADIIVRLMIAPHRNHKFIEDLCDGITELQPATELKAMDRAAEPTVGRLEESLLRHFEQSTVSREVLKTLASQARGMSEAEVLAAVNHRLAQKRRRELRAAIVRKVVMILMGADFVVLRDGSLWITDVGKHLNACLHRRNQVIA